MKLIKVYYLLASLLAAFLPSAAATNNLRAIPIPSEKTDPHPHQRAVQVQGHFLSFEFNGVPRYLKITSDGWAIYKSREDEATEFEEYKYKDKTYYKVRNGTWKGYYLSYNARGYLGAFSWINAVAWRNNSLDKPCLTVDVNGFRGVEYVLGLNSRGKTFVYDQSYVVFDVKWSNTEAICMKKP